MPLSYAMSIGMRKLCADGVHFESSACMCAESWKHITADCAQTAVLGVSFVEGLRCTLGSLLFSPSRLRNEAKMCAYATPVGRPDKPTKNLFGFLKENWCCVNHSGARWHGLWVRSVT